MKFYISGAFGKVFHGFLANESDQTVKEVAIKTVKGICVYESLSLIVYIYWLIMTQILCFYPSSLECQNMDELNLFISESVIMKNFQHRNILNLVGVSVGIIDEIAAPYIILPFMANGDLKGYLQQKRSEAEDNPESLLKVLCSIYVIVCK